MAGPADLQAQQTGANAAEPGYTKRRSGRRLVLGMILWIVGAAILVAVGFVAHTHPKPWAFELDFTKILQWPHTFPCLYNARTRTWIDAGADLINSFNDPIPSVAIPILGMIILMLFRRFRQAILLGIAVLSATGVWFAIEMYVGRPRAIPSEGICVHRVIAAYSFPSGHVVHDVVLFGFLLYVSFSEPVRSWRYRWVLLPLQLLVLLYMLSVGFARLEAGEHLLIDVLGGYLVALLWLFFFIFLDRRIAGLQAKHRQKKIAQLPFVPFDYHNGEMV